MFGGIALAYSALPLELLEQDDLRRRLHERGGEREVQFLFRDHTPVLPAWHQGQLLLVTWGNRRRESRRNAALQVPWQQSSLPASERDVGNASVGVS